jgi:hypothetical protein
MRCRLPSRRSRRPRSRSAAVPLPFCNLRGFHVSRCGGKTRLSSQRNNVEQRGLFG